MRNLVLIILVLLCSFSLWLYWRHNTVNVIRPVIYNPYKEQLKSIATIGNDIISTQPIKKSTRLFNNKLKDLVNNTVNILVGKYKITDPNNIDHLRNNIINAVNYLDKNYQTEQLLEWYNPGRSYELILEGSRSLFEYPQTDIMSKLLLGQYIISKSSDNKEINNIYNFIIRIATNPNYPPKLRANASDILNLSNNRQYIKVANNALEILRREEDVDTIPRPDPPYNPFVAGTQINNQNVPLVNPWLGANRDQQQALLDDVQRRAGLNKNKPERTIYNDGQNVHYTEINESALMAARDLIKSFTPNGKLNFDYSLTTGMPADKLTKIEASLHRILTDPTTFKYGVTPYALFQSLLKFINDNPNKADINQRLIEELLDMSGQCISGHMSRLVNVIQGYSDMKITMNITNEIYAKVSHIIQKGIMSAPNSEELMDDLQATDKTVSIEFITKIINYEIPSIVTEYSQVADKQDVINNIKIALDKYTFTKGKFETIGN